MTDKSTDHIALAKECGGASVGWMGAIAMNEDDLKRFVARIAKAEPAVKGAPCKVGDPRFEAWAESEEYDCTKITNEHIHATAYTSNDTLNAFRGWRAALSVAPIEPDRDDAQQTLTLTERTPLGKAMFIADKYAASEDLCVRPALRAMLEQAIVDYGSSVSVVPAQDREDALIAAVSHMREWQKQSPGAAWAKKHLEASEAFVDAALAARQAPKVPTP